MSTTENTNAIDEKKNTDTGSRPPDVKGFITNYMSSIIFTIGVSIFIIGGLGLYTTKVAQANILPDNIKLAPYTIFDRVVTNEPIDINIMRPPFFSDNKEILSQKVEFYSREYLDSFNKSFLCSLKQNADPTAGFFANVPLYLSLVCDNIVAKNFLAVNTIFFYLSYLPEWAIMFLYGIFGIFLWFGLYVFNLCISIFYHIMNVPQLFRVASETDNKKWESNDNISFLRIVKWISIFFLWIPIVISIFVAPIIFTIYGLISPLFASYRLKQTNKSLNVFDFIKNTFAYKRLFFLILATVSLFSNGRNYLGNTAVIGIVIAVLFAYFMGLYTNEMPEPGVDGFSFKIKQNLKPSSVDEINIKDPKLVEICQHIPIDDVEFEKMIQGIKPRDLTEIKVKGGDGDSAPVTAPVIAPVTAAIAPNIVTKGGKRTSTINPKKKYNIRLV